MTTSTLSALLTSSIATLWDYITTLFTPLLVLGIGLAVVALIFYFIKRAPRKIF